jgi:hypothetical protein
MDVDQSYWGVQGWEVSVTASTYAGCFSAVPSTYTVTPPLHHVVFANNVANGCFADGFGTGYNGTASSDYIAIVGNIAYNAAAGSNCYSGISVYKPIEYDSLPGTHIYIAGNFSFGNINTNPCGGGAPTDAEGITLDTLDGSQSSLTPYAAQVMVDNNMMLNNGGRGFQVFNNSNGIGPFAHVYVRYNTLWGNNADTNETNNLCGEMLIHIAINVEEFRNLAATNATYGCGGYPLYAYYVANADGSSHVHSDVGWAASGTYSQISSNLGFSYGPSNLFGTNPSFVNATAPGAPSCGSASSVPNCMATVIANFTPTTTAAVGYGYQIPSTAQSYDPLFPQWLCNVNLPTGLVTMGCLAGSSVSPLTMLRVTIQ